MKQLLVTIFFFTSFISHAQWLPGEYVDDFGDGTGQTYLYQEVTGTFSYSASTNTKCRTTADSKCSFFLELCKDDGLLGISVYPNGQKQTESWKESSFQVIKIKNSAGNVTEIDCFCTDDGVVFLAVSNFEKLMETIKDTGEYKVSLFHKLDDSESLYKFSFVN